MGTHGRCVGVISEFYSTFSKVLNGSDGDNGVDMAGVRVGVTWLMFLTFYSNGSYKPK